MAFRDQILRCAATGKTFVWTVAEQRERARRGLPMDPPLYCPEVRAADVRLAGGDDELDLAEAHGEAPATLDRDEHGDAIVADAAAPVHHRGRDRGGVQGGGRGARGGGGRDGRGAGHGARGGRPGRGGRMDGGDVPAQDELRVRHIGTVKWFDAERGFGFVVHEEGGELFLHGSSLLGDSVAALREGTPVEYEVVNTARGKRAVDVVPLA